MKYRKDFFKLLNKYWLYFILLLAIFILLVELLYLGNYLKNWEWNKELISALLGAAIVTAITSLLLNGQAKKDSEVDQKKKVFENRVKAYESFLDILRGVVVKNKVTQEDEKLLQFGVATIGMHANSQEMLRLSVDLKRIIQKIKVEQPVGSSIWKEVIDIVRMFQFSLYEKQSMENDSNMNKALRNFSGLCTDENHTVLEYVECMLSDFHFDSFIADDCLFLSLPIQPRVRRSIRINECIIGKIPKRLYVTLKVNQKSEKSLYSGSISIYCGDKTNEKKTMDVIYNKYWFIPQMPKIAKTDIIKSETEIELSINHIKNSYIYLFSEKTKIELQDILVCIFVYINEIWAGKKKLVTFMTIEGDNKKAIIKKDFGYGAKYTPLQ